MNIYYRERDRTMEAKLKTNARKCLNITKILPLVKQTQNRSINMSAFYRKISRKTKRVVWNGHLSKRIDSTNLMSKAELLL